MSISAIQATTPNPYQLSISSPYQTELQQLGQAIQSGNLTAAQSDFATLQQAFSQPATTSGSTSGTASTTTNPTAQAFSQLGSDLQSGNLTAAQNDLSTVQQDLNSHPLNNLRHYHHMGGGSGDSNEQNSLLQELNQTGQSLSSTNLAGAQQAYASLQQQLQQFALGGSALSSLAPISFDA